MLAAIGFVIVFCMAFLFFLWIAASIEGERPLAPLRPTWQGVAILLLLIALSGIVAYSVVTAPEGCDPDGPQWSDCR